MTVIDEHIKTLPTAKRVALERIRTIVKEVVPEAEETISYGLPTLKYNGKPLVHFEAFKDHLSLFPTADPSLGELEARLKPFRTAKGTLQFTEDNQIPEDVIKEIIRIRLQSIS